MSVASHGCWCQMSWFEHVRNIAVFLHLTFFILKVKSLLFTVFLSFLLIDDESSKSPYHQERHNVSRGQLPVPGQCLVAAKLSNESITSIEERPLLVKKELQTSLPYIPENTLPYRGTLFAMDPRNGYLDPHYSKWYAMPSYWNEHRFKCCQHYSQ